MIMPNVHSEKERGIVCVCMLVWPFCIDKSCVQAKILFGNMCVDYVIWLRFSERPPVFKVFNSAVPHGSWNGSTFDRKAICCSRYDFHQFQVKPFWFFETYWICDCTNHMHIHLLNQIVRICHFCSTSIKRFILWLRTILPNASTLPFARFPSQFYLKSIWTSTKVAAWSTKQS